MMIAWVQRNIAAAIALGLVAVIVGTPLKVAHGEPATIKAPASTGRLHLVFTERSPLSTQDEVLRRIDADPWSVRRAEADKANLDYNLADESFEAFVPPAYKPDVPYGLFVWTGVRDIPPAWQGIFSRHKLIWVSANIVQGRKGFLRVQLPIDAVHNMKKLYNIDENRVYVGGFSAGGGAATFLVCAFPEAFRGGYFLMGGRFYLTYRSGAGPWDTTVERLTPIWKGPLDQIKREMRLVFMRGQTDTVYNPQEDRGQYESLLLEGFTRVAYFEVPRLAHDLPNALWFERGIVALDQSKPTIPPTTSPTTQPHPLPSQIAQAQRLLATAQMMLDAKNKVSPSRRNKAREYLQQVLAEYPTTPAAPKARQMLDGN